jgi:hypothetical protein
MSKKFDVVIGNPPYQDDLIGDNETKAPPIYDKFMDAAYEVGEQAVLITPARFLSNAGQTPKAWNHRMLNDPHLKVAVFEPKSATIFPGTDIKGGVVVTHRDATRVLGPIGDMAHLSDMESVVAKVKEHGQVSLATIITEHPCKWADVVFTDHPTLRARIPTSSGTRLKSNTFTRMAEVCLPMDPADGHEHIGVLGISGRARVTRWVRRDYLITPSVVDKWKVVLAKANGSGEFGEALSAPEIVGPKVGLTQTFVAVGLFDDQREAAACLTYIKSKFARALLSTLKTTQDNPAIKWTNIPLQAFTSASDIDWSKSIAEIDQQLYAKYGLDDEEIAFIEANVKPMS